MRRRERDSAGSVAWFAAVIVITLLTMAVLSGTRTLISYRALALGGDALAIGVITSAFAVVPLFLALTVGRTVDRGRGIAALRIGSILITVAVLLTMASSELVLLTLGSALLGVGQICSTVAAQGLIPMWSRAADFDRRFSNLTLAVSAGQLVGFPIAGAIASITTPPGTTDVATTPALGAMAVLAAASIPFCFGFKNQGLAAVSRREHAQNQQSSMALLHTPGMKPAIYASLLLLTSTDILAAYLPLLGQEFGISVGVITALLTIRAVASVISRAILPRLLHRVRRRTLLVASTLLAALPIGLLPVIPLPLAMGVLVFVFGFFFGLGQPLTMSWVTSVAHESNRGAALAVRLAGNRIGQIVLPLGVSGVATFAGTGAIFVVLAALLLSATTVTVRGTRHMK